MYDEYISTWVKQQTALLIFLLHYYSVILHSKVINHSTPKEINWVHHLGTGIWGTGTKPTFPGKRSPPSLKRHHLYHHIYVHSSDNERFTHELSLFSSVHTHTCTFTQPHPRQCVSLVVFKSGWYFFGIFRWCFFVQCVSFTLTVSFTKVLLSDNPLKVVKPPFILFLCLPVSNAVLSVPFQFRPYTV